MSDDRQKNNNWRISAPFTWEAAHAAILMDIRDELQKLNQVFECHRFLQIPTELKQIRLNTIKRRRKAKR